MEAILKQLCAEHGLTSINVTYHHGSHVSVFVHWEDAGGNRAEYDIGKTFDKALPKALARMAGRRSFAAEAA